MVNAQPTRAALYMANPTDGNRRIFKVNLQWKLNLNDPPTAVAGIDRNPFVTFFFKDHKAVLQTLDHSLRSAINGSTLAAWRAGSQQANMATAISKRGTARNVIGSVGSTW